jgi:hypothetical protein
MRQSRPDMPGYVLGKPAGGLLKLLGMKDGIFSAQHRGTWKKHVEKEGFHPNNFFFSFLNPLKV